MKKSPEPYRFLFPVGLVFGIVGVSLWIGFGVGAPRVFPSVAHGQIMIGAFLLSFVAGFLMTAVPKLTASFPATLNESLFAMTLTIASGVLAYSGASELFFLATAASIATLIVFCLRRFAQRTKKPPTFFAFVGTALLSGFVGAMICALTPEGPGTVHDFGWRLLSQGMVLLLVLGIGQRLIPVLTGNKVEEPKPGPFKHSGYITSAALALAIPVCLALETAGDLMIGGLAKAVVATVIALMGWKLHQKKQTKSFLALGMKTSGVFVLVGLWLSALQPSLAIHLLHLTYVGGFGLMTLTVASRVTLAHGNYDLALESEWKSLLLIGGLLVLAALTRVGASFIPTQYVSHLVYAATIWIFALTLWAIVFILRIVRKGPQPVAACK